MNISNNNQYDGNFGEIKISSTHLPILINNNTDLDNFPEKTGNGTLALPYVIENLTIDAGGSGSPISISNTDKYLIIRNCTLEGSGSTSNGGIRLYLSKNVNVTDCKIYDNEYGIFLDKTDNISVLSNDIHHNNQDGIQLSEANYTLIEDNEIYYNSFAGIILFGSCYNTIRLNNVSYQGSWGIYITGISSTEIIYSMYNEVYLNTIWNNPDGIYEDGVDNNIYNNDIRGVKPDLDLILGIMIPVSAFIIVVIVYFINKRGKKSNLG